MGLEDDVADGRCVLPRLHWLPTADEHFLKSSAGDGLHLGDRKLISVEVDHDRQLRCSHPRTSANISQVSAVQMRRDFRWN